MCICFEIHGRRICICLPLLILEWWRIPEPDPPYRFIMHDRISREIEHDLRAVGTLHAVAAKLSR